jgi:response regulator RpfG family c-di-GMP phosphodiesterase
LPILLVTGYTATLTAAAVKALGIRALALKPLNLETLGRSVHEILSASPDAAS